MAAGARVRRTVSSDADRLGEIHVRAWQAAYRGVMPDRYLETPGAAGSAPACCGSPSPPASH